MSPIELFWTAKKTSKFEKMVTPQWALTYSAQTQLHIGVLDEKYDLAESEFKIWPSNYDLD